MNHPTTKRIMDFLYDDYAIRTSCVLLQNKMADMRPIEEFTGWCDECFLWDTACEMKEAQEKAESYKYIDLEELKKLMRREECDNLVELTDYCFYEECNKFTILSLRLPAGRNLRQRLKDFWTLLPIDIRSYWYIWKISFQNRYSYIRIKWKHARMKKQYDKKKR